MQAMPERVSQTASPPASPQRAAFPVARNIVLLAACLTALSGTIQLAVAVATLTLVLVTGIESIVGLGPAIFLTSAAIAAFPAGRAMDRYGRVPVLAAGFVAGAAGCLLTALGAAVDSPAAVVAGFVLVGVNSGAVLLARAAAADMVPPARKARAISFVLFGALFGAALGPLVFRPLFEGREIGLDNLVVPWLAAAGICLVGLVLALAIRPDPRTIALALETDDEAAARAGAIAPLSEILRRPGVPTALVAAIASFAVMVGVMNLTGYIVVGHQHEQADVFTVISAHIVGMYALVLVVGELVDRVGRRESAVAGLAIMAASTLPLWWVESVLWTSVALFGLGLGWSISYVAAAAELVTRAAPEERGKLVGFTDLASGLTGAALALLGGVAYTQIGVSAVAIGATLIVVAPAVLIAFRAAAGARLPADEPV
jgi:MFS family permease